jgi:ABC-type lipoprotein export system ATPase subunit/predicted metal-dependent phosphoesterase TrpH
MPHREIGSTWGKWDLHFHTPSSYDYNDRSVTNAQIVDGLRAADIVAVAVTDHHRIDVGRIRELQRLGGDELTIFPGIELRTELGGGQYVHMIGIFSELADPDYIWTKLQGPLRITPAEVAAQGDDAVYVNFREAADLIRELKGVVSVHVGRKTNSLDQIRNNQPYKEAFKTDIARQYVHLYEVGQLRDIEDHVKVVFPKIGVEKPLFICSDNHDIKKYVLKAPCWVKADPSFESFHQIVSDPSERVFIGDIPESVKRVRRNKTKYIESISFEKLVGSDLAEEWFSGEVKLNPGLVAVIGNKGTGKTALVESIGLLGNTAQSQRFSFLSPRRFRQLRSNKAAHFRATLKWQDGKTYTKTLSQDVEPNTVEAVGYLPQNYLEAICNEIETAQGDFEKVLKSVIFSHVDDANKQGADSIDELLAFLTKQTEIRLQQLRQELKDIVRVIYDNEQTITKENRKRIQSELDEKRRELEALNTIRPSAPLLPSSDESARQQADETSAALSEKRSRLVAGAETIKVIDLSIRASVTRRTRASLLVQSLDNFRAAYDSFLLSATPNCLELDVSPNELVNVVFDYAKLNNILEDSSAVETQQRQLREATEREGRSLQDEIDQLTLALEGPNLEYQKALQSVEDWNALRLAILGDPGQLGTLRNLETQMAGITGIPSKLSELSRQRDGKIREIYREIKKVITTYSSLYTPVQEFITQNIANEAKFAFEFEASISCVGLGPKFFAYVNQGRKGSFCGIDEGQAELDRLIKLAQFDSEDGVLSFVNELLGHLKYDMREPVPSEIMIVEQLRRDMRDKEADLVNLVCSLDYMTPHYLLKWSGKAIEELSPGERGTLLLIFFLTVDRRETPLIIDQPEENLDNHTVFHLLVPCIKSARKRRQVILVTHNPNLAVVCDADQVIHCSIDKKAGNKVSYQSGGLEDPKINRLTINVLEGTRPAFSRRDAKYCEESSPQLPQ